MQTQKYGNKMIDAKNKKNIELINTENNKMYQKKGCFSAKAKKELAKN